MSGKINTVYKKLVACRFPKVTIDTITRIEDNPDVVGILFMKNRSLQVTTLPEITTALIAAKLPELSSAVRNAVKEITKMVNDVNPIVDRIMDDDSVGGVILTNSEGLPILTNFATSLTNSAISLRALGKLAVSYIKDFNPLEEVLVLRVKTKKNEIMLVPHEEFSVIVFQNSTYVNKKVHENQYTPTQVNK